VDADAVRRVLRHGKPTRLLHMYGPTETTAWCSCAEVEELADGALTVSIGLPTGNQRIYLLDVALEPVPMCVAGEAYVGGGGVVRGYLDRPALTAERFVPDPFSSDPGARMYRTGDRLRRMADGTLEFVGRLDEQVKIRGFRIEPGEVESALTSHPAVREVRVLAREDEAGEKRLVAYVVGEAAADDLRAHLRHSLPEYMVPGAFVTLDRLPLTPNGKLDVKALPAPGDGAFGARAYEAPAGETEAAVAGIWADVLRVDLVGRWDDFFELGGHSLRAVQVVSRVRRLLGAEVALVDLFTRPVLADFARGVEEAGRADLPAIEPVERTGPLPLSFAQQRLWFLEQLGGGGAAYHVPTRMRLGGELDPAALVRALDHIVARHEALRTTFGEVDGHPVQRIAPADESAFRLLDHDLREHPDAEGELRRLVAEEAGAPFDLERGPLIRGRLIRLAADDHALLVTMHHVVSDGWSMGVLTRELSALYGAFRRGEADPLPALPIQYADYAAWQRRWVDGEVLQAQAAYWTETLAGVPELLELPTDRARPARQDFAGASMGVVLDEERVAGLKALSRRGGTTLFMTLLAGWSAVLGRLAGRDDVVVGTPTANRGRSEIEGLIGFFVNTLALRVDLSGSPSVSRLLERVKERALGAQRHQDIPFEQVVELAHPARSLAHSPLVQVMFAWQNAPEGTPELPGLTLAPVGRSAGGTSRFDLSLTLYEDGGRIRGAVEYATALFDGATVGRSLSYLRRVLEAMAADEHRSVEALPLLPEAERRLLVEEWNATDAEYAADACVHELFEARAARAPDASAVVFGEMSLSYGELNARANRLARYLHERGVGPDARVAICAERGVEMIVGLLAILKAGGAYVPLDPAYPVDRLRYMLADAAPVALLTHAAAAGLLDGIDVPVVDLANDSPEWSGHPETDVGGRGAGLTSAHPAYVIYTSGSTGLPKGVVVEHRGVCNLVAAQSRDIPVDPGSRVLQFASFSFDACVFEVVMALCKGASLHLPPRGVVLAGEALVRAIEEGEITHVTLPPAVLATLPDGAELGTVRTMVLAGDVVTEGVVKRWAPGRRLLNAYGPTETTVWATVQECRSGGAGNPAIGRPIANTRVYVVDRRGEPAPTGVAGELCIGGAGVARGYLGRPQLTAERFVPDAFSQEPGARLYRTGDLGRWLADGTLEFLGRADFQVKVRGFRIEPGEIEARLLEHPSVREAAVLAREDAPGDRRLVAYHVGDAVDAEALRAHLSASLPEYMVPAAYVRLDALPLTANGKLDRRALPAPEGDAYASRAYEPPVGEVEVALAEIWSDVLGVERVGRWDDFFELGGHSLRAVQVVSRIRQLLGVEVALGDLFVRPVLAELARGMEEAGRAELPPIERADRTAALPLSFAQQRLWFLERLGSAGAAYHIPVRLRLRGELDRDALGRALDRIVARHEALRTTFEQVDGHPVQRIAPAGESAFRLLDHDLRAHPEAESEFRLVMAEEAGAPFDLERGPLIRGRLVRLAGDDHALLVTMHHVVSDGWSMGVLTRELSALYGAFSRGEPDPLPALAIQYADYAAWQRRWVDGEVLQAQVDYWKETLSGAPELLVLPTDHPRPARQDFAGASVEVVIDEALTAGLKALSKRHGTTLFMTLLAGWSVVLGRLTGQDDVVVGTPTANRGRGEIEGLIGFFVNTLALRVDLSESPSVSRLLKRVKERVLGAQASQDIPFEQVVELVRPARSLAHAPLFQVMLTWQNTPRRGLELPGLELAPVERAEQVAAKFDLSLFLAEAGGRVAGGMEYATALFERATVERCVAYFRRVLEGMVAGESRSVAELPLLPEAERRQVLEAWNATAQAYPGELCIHALIEARVERAPHAVAVAHDGEPLTHAELDARASQLAHHLRGLGVGPDVRVAICVERGPEMIVGVLAVLKAGGAYVPLDPSYPADRLRYVLADSAPAALLTQASLAGAFADVGVPRIELDAGSAAWAGRPRTTPEGVGVRPDHLAYVIYTSGSTGRPKGVMVRHRGLAHYALWAAARYTGGQPLAFALYSSIAFDLTVTSVFVPLLTGGSIVVYADSAEGDTPIQRVFAEARVDVVKLTPAHLALLGGRELRAGRIQRLIVGGEELKAPLARAVVEASGGRLEIYNEYGPTETVVGCMVHRFDALLDQGAAVPIGRPISNTRIYLLDASGQPVPVGVVGELYVGGVGVARGYLDRPGLTAERFVADPFGGRAGACMYRTGDLARRRPDGSIEYLGRDDFQVKVRGFRIEPGEIEARLSAEPGVRGAVVLAREDVPGDRRLVAYYAGDETVAAETLRARLSATLPEHMVPSAYVRLDALPLTRNGKVDRKALPVPEGDAYATRAYEPPAGATEEALTEVWAELLRRDRVGRRDDFFELGGHSLLAVQVVSRIRQILGVEVALGELFARPVLADFARGVDEAARAELPPIEPVERDERIPLSFAQQRLWFLERLDGGGAAYHIPTRMRLRGALDRGALVRALDRIVARHEALRTTFAEEDGQPVQRIAPAEASAFRLLDHDLRRHADAEAELRRVTAEEAAAPFDLERGPLVRARLVRLAAEDHVLLVTLHHIVSDGWSMGVLTRELSALYGAFQRGEADPLPALALQYADYAAWQRRWVDGALLQAQAEYWTETLGGAPELLELPADHPRPARQDFAGASVAVLFDQELTGGLKALSRRSGTTLFMTLLAGWATVLGRLADQDDVVVGTPTANRGRREIEGLIGFFVNTLALRVDLSGPPSVAQLLKRVKARALGAQGSQDIPFEQVVELVHPARSLAHTPLFQVMFAWQNAGEGGLELPGLALVPAEGAAQATAKFDLSLGLHETGGRIIGGVEYAAALFERATVERYAGYLRRVLEGMVADDHRSVAELPLLPEAERRQVVEEWSAARSARPADACVHTLFEAQVERRPEAVAVVFGDVSLTYRELNARANRLAHHLAARGVGPDARVGICAERSLEMVVALLAVLKAGGAYVPLDPAYPAERLRAMLADSAPVALLTRGAPAGVFAEAEAALIDLEADAAAWRSRPDTNPARAELTPEHLCYVIYTSGSTGLPKGTEVPHRAIPGFFRGVDYARFDEAQVLLQHSSTSWDALTLELFPALLCGGTCVLYPGRASEPAVLGEQVRAHGVTTLWLTSAYFNSIVDASPRVLAGVRQVMVGGEAVSVPHLRRALELYPELRLVNGYGPSECTVFTSCFPVPRGFDAPAVPIGRPVGDRRAYVLDRSLNPVPVGVPGELFVGGPAVARGYLNRPRLTAESFVPDPFSGRPGARLYRTGDRVRWRAGGVLEFVGRVDFQVKVRGFRIELGEIEARLAEHPSVREAAVLAREDAPGDRRLVAYYVGEAADAEALRAHLSAGLPEYMVPRAYVRLEAMPLTAHGKVNRGAFSAPEATAFAARAYEAPEGDTEQALAEIWADVLRAESVGRWDDFFELGGHSLLAVRVVSRIRQVLGVEVALGELFVRPVLADFARGLEEAARAELPEIEPADRTQALPLSFAQQRLWFLERLGSGGAAYHVPVRLRLRGELDTAALAHALDRIVARHEALRTTFAEVDGRVAQRILPAEESGFPLAEHDLGGHSEADAELRRLMADEAGAPFDLECGPLVRGRLVRLGADDHVLLVTMHHVVSDGWSMGVLTRELGATYGAFRRGEPDPLPALPIQYADYAAWQRRWVDGEVLQAQAAYWMEALAGAPELLELPTDHPRPARQDFAGASVAVALDEALADGLKALSKRHGTTLFMTLLAGWATVLGRLSGQEDIVVGTPTANRGRREVEGLIGFFVNTLALRADLSGSATVAELLGRVKERALAAQHHQDIPFEQVVELVRPARSLAHSPLFQVMFAWQNTGESRLDLPGLTLAPVEGTARTAAKFDLSLTLSERAGGSRARWTTPPRSSSGTRWSAGSATCGRCWRRWPRTSGGAWRRCRSFPRRSAGRWWRSGTRPPPSIRRTCASTSCSRRGRNRRPARWRWSSAARRSPTPS
jgi:amino acid adenylation domain-containing protein